LGTPHHLIPAQGGLRRTTCPRGHYTQNKQRDSRRNLTQALLGRGLVPVLREEDARPCTAELEAGPKGAPYHPTVLAHIASSNTPPRPWYPLTLVGLTLVMTTGKRPWAGWAGCARIVVVERRPAGARPSIRRDQSLTAKALKGSRWPGAKGTAASGIRRGGGGVGSGDWRKPVGKRFRSGKALLHNQPVSRDEEKGADILRHRKVVRGLASAPTAVTARGGGAMPRETQNAIAPDSKEKLRFLAR